MRLYYMAYMRFPNEKAHGKQVMEMCNALARHAEITLVVPGRGVRGPAEGLDARIRLVRLYAPNTLWLGAPGFLFSYVWFSLRAALLVRRAPAPVLTREFGCAAACGFFGMPSAWESHRGQWNWVVRYALRRGARLVVITHGLKRLYEGKGVPSRAILVAPDGVDLSRYRDLPHKEEARKKIGLPAGRKLAVYNGHLHTWKGAGTVAEAAKLLPQEYLVAFVGGTDKDIEAFREKHGDDPRIAVLGRKGDAERPLYLRAADAVLLPNSGKDEISVSYTSPLKLFGYMAAGAPIVASDLPSIREVVDESAAYFAEPDDPHSFARMIREACEHPQEAQEKGARARALAPRYEWDNRAKAILEFMQAA